ncbi:MAG: hypothetical protein LBP51_00920, partial [Deferribacteraceae bacterium]|nr:hypothetical protein [Deferribacteraceae bacterium]
MMLSLNENLPISKLKADGYDVYIVGGAVRDIILELPLQDIDITVFGGDYRNYADLLARRIRRRPISFKGNIRLPFGRFHIDISAPRGEDIRADLALRDFTINNLALNLEGGLLGDPSDIYAKKIKPAYPRSLLDDPIRILRAFRFAALLDFELTESFFALAGEACPFIRGVANERICQELRYFSCADPNEYLYEQLAHYGILQTVFGFEPNLKTLIRTMKSVYSRVNRDILFPIFLAALYVDSRKNIKRELKTLTVSNDEQDTAQNLIRLATD